MHEEYGECGCHQKPNSGSPEMILSGPIVRINPNEVHFNDPDFIDTLYPTTGRKTDKPLFVGQRSGSRQQAHLQSELKD